MEDSAPDEAPPQDLAPQFAPVGSDALPAQFGIWALTNYEELIYMENTFRGLTMKVDPKSQEVEWVRQFKCGSCGHVWFEEKDIDVCPHCLNKDFYRDPKPVMNDQGVFEVMRFLRGFTSKLVTLSNIPEVQMYFDLNANAFEIITFLFVNYRRFELKPAKFPLICTEIVNYIETSLFKAMDGAMTDFVHPKYKTVESRIIQGRVEEPKKRGIGGYLGL